MSDIDTPAPAPMISARTTQDRHSARNSVRARASTARTALLRARCQPRTHVVAERARRSASPVLRRRVARVDQGSYRAVLAHVVPSPAHQHPEAVLEPDQVIEVHREPDDPTHETGESQPPDTAHRGGATDGR